MFGLFKRKQSKPQKTEFKFVVKEGHWVGDQYEYSIPAKSKEEATNKFIEFMFGNKHFDEIKSSHAVIYRPGSEVLVGHGNIEFRQLLAKNCTAGTSKEDREALRAIVRNRGLEAERI